MFINVADLAAPLQIPESALRLLLSTFLGFPLALVHRHSLYAKDAFSQHLFFVLCGMTIGFWNFGWNITHTLTTILATYAVLKVFGASRISIALSFVINMGYLLYGYYTINLKSYDISWTMPQCILTLKLIGLAFNVADGKRSEDKLSASQKETALKEMPSLLEVAAFSYFPGSFLVGPQFSMKRYLDFVNGVLIPKEKDTLNEDGLPKCLKPALMRTLVGLLVMTLYQIGSLVVTDDYIASAEYANRNYFVKQFLLGLWGQLTLMKYISVWLIAEGVCISFALPYNGKDSQGNVKWDACHNVLVMRFFTATQFAHYIEAFNVNTNRWSAEYIYKRVKFLGSKLYSQLATLAFLAIWHGFHIGYYHMFYLEFIIMYLERDYGGALAKNEALQNLLKNNAVARVVSIILLRIYSFIFMGYCIAPLGFLTFSKYSPVLASIYYTSDILYVSLVVLAPFIKPILRGKSKPKAN